MGRLFSICTIIFAFVGGFSGAALAEPGPARDPGHVGCADGSVPEDGCEGAPAGASMQFKDFFSGYAAQSGQSYSPKSPNAGFNLPGVNYPVGPGRRTGLKDAWNPAFWPTHSAPFEGCKLNDNKTWWELVCRGNTLDRWDWNGYDFRANPNRASANKGPVFLSFKNTVPSQQTIENSYFANDDNCGGGSFINADSGTPASFIIRSNYFGGNVPKCMFQIGGGIGLHSRGGVVVERNFFDNVPGRPINFTVADGVTAYVQYNLVVGCGTGPWQGHGECDTISAPSGVTTANVVVRYNTFLLPATNSFAGFTTTLFLSDGLAAKNGAGAFDRFVVDHNAFIVNNVCPSSGGKNGHLAFHIDNGDGTGVGNVLTVDKFSGRFPLCVGTSIGAKGLFATVTANVSGSGVGSKWLLACQLPVSTCMESGQVKKDADHPDINVPNVNVVVNSGDYINAVSSAACALTKGTYKQLSITNNVCDVTGDVFGYYFSAAPGSICEHPAVFSGNRNLLTGRALDGWNANSSQGC